MENKKLDISKISHRIDYGKLSDDAISLRKKIFVNEKEYLTEEQLITNEDINGFNISIYYDSEIIASISGVNGELSFLPIRNNISSALFKNTLYLSRGMVLPEYRGLNIFYFMLYLCGREATYRERSNIFIYKSTTESSLDKVLNFKILHNLGLLEFKGKNNFKYTLTPISIDTSYMRYKCWNYMGTSLQEYTRKNLLSEEIKRTVLKLTDKFYQNPWIQAIYNGNLTKNQYMESLANNYQFVKWTTRLLARVVSLTENEQLRNHYLEHLKGEINHEKIVERDLKKLGADIDYIKSAMVPNYNINKFMCVQESLSSFYNDPILFLAVPIAIESVTAHLTGDFLIALEKCISNWGIDNPKDAMRYLSSHIHTDGDPDGHWDQTMLSINNFLKTESQTIKFLNIIHMVLEAFTDGYADIMRKPDLESLYNKNHENITV